MFLVRRMRAALASLGVLGLVMAGALPAFAASGKPTTPTQLFHGYRNCATEAQAPTYLPGSQGVLIEGVPGDTDSAGSSLLTVEYRIRPVDDPHQTLTLSNDNVRAGWEGPVTVPASALVDGQTYRWQARTVAEGDASDWSSPCYFRVDNTGPSKAPTVTSSNYAEGQWNPGGATVEFTFDAAGVTDVTGFEFSWEQHFPVIGTDIGAYGIPQPKDPYDDTRHFVRTDTPGGSATVHLAPPDPGGPTTLWVRSLDRAFNGSPTATYSFFIDSTAPTVTPRETSPQYGDSVTFDLAPNPDVQAASPVVGYTVHSVQGSPGTWSITVPAASDGTAHDGEDGRDLR